MSAEFSNVYDDEERADSYAELEFPGTYYLALQADPLLLDDPAARFIGAPGKFELTPEKRAVELQPVVVTRESPLPPLPV